MKINLKSLMLIFLTSILFACNKDVDQSSSAKKDAEAQSNESEVDEVKSKVKKVAPEDDPNLTGTSVLGFKLRDSTYDSVKDRLENFSIAEYETYAGGPVLENDGSGFNIEGLLWTQFGFDESNRLVYVGMALKESDPMSHATYDKVVSYIKKNDYKVTKEKAPFVGDRETYFTTPNNESILVSSPHMGGFKVYAEYYTNEFDRIRTDAQKKSEQQQVQSESANF